jgi:hypothetical protein
MLDLAFAPVRDDLVARLAGKPDPAEDEEWKRIGWLSLMKQP